MQDELSFSDYIRPILWGTLAVIIVAALLTMILSVVMTNVDFPLGFSMPAAVVVLGLSTLAGGFIGAKMLGKKGFFIGFCVGLLSCILILLVNLSFQPQGFGGIALMKGAVMLIGGIVGGVIGVNRQRTRIKI